VATLLTQDPAAAVEALYVHARMTAGDACNDDDCFGGDLNGHR
jgi:hypothetical protein